MEELKEIEAFAQSNKSWEDAAQIAVINAITPSNSVKSILIKQFDAQVRNNKIVGYRINAKIFFETGEP